jgi:hypothetical protein
MKSFLELAVPKFSLLNIFIEKPLVMLSTIPAIVVVNVVVDFKSVAYILFWMFLSDLVTGLFASYFEWKKSLTRKEKWFFGKGEGFSSDKFKKMIFKAIAYIGLTLLLIKFQKALMLKNFRYESFSHAEFELATIALIVFCLNEGFSIFHENLPKCGFNLWHRIKKIIGFYKEVKKEIND